MAGYFVFDIESIVDGHLLRDVKYHDKTADEAIALAEQDELTKSNGSSSFIPVTYHIPISIGILQLSSNFTAVNKAVLSGNNTKKIVSDFWALYHTAKPILVSFNGRGFDLPLLELMAMKYNITIPDRYWGKNGTRGRYSGDHVDLMDFLSNYGAYKVSGGLDAVSKLIGYGGKAAINGCRVDGKSVKDLYNRGEYKLIDDYCMNDVINTYAVFLRTRAIIGIIDCGHEQTCLESINRITGI